MFQILPPFLSPWLIGASNYTKTLKISHGSSPFFGVLVYIFLACSPYKISVQTSQELVKESATFSGDQTSYMPTQVADIRKEHGRHTASLLHILA